MGQKRIIANLRKRYKPEKVEKRITDYQARVKKNLARQAIYLQLIADYEAKRLQAYDNRKLVKAGERESCKQRKRRLRKEYLAKKSETLKS